MIDVAIAGAGEIIHGDPFFVGPSELVRECRLLARCKGHSVIGGTIDIDAILAADEVEHEQIVPVVLLRAITGSPASPFPGWLEACHGLSRLFPNRRRCEYP